MLQLRYSIYVQYLDLFWLQLTPSIALENEWNHSTFMEHPHNAYCCFIFKPYWDGLKDIEKKDFHSSFIPTSHKPTRCVGIYNYFVICYNLKFILQNLLKIICSPQKLNFSKSIFQLSIYTNISLYYFFLFFYFLCNMIFVTQ